MNDLDPIARWHDIIRRQDPDLLDDLLADTVVFRSPAVHTPQAGRERTKAYLSAALAVLGPGLEYRREWRGENSAVLEFTTTIADIEVHGIDMIAWDDASRITEFTVMARPTKGLQVLIEHMGAELARASS